MIGVIGRYLQKKDLQDFIDLLRTQDAMDTAVVMIIATAYRNSVRNIHGLDFISPSTEFNENHPILRELATAITYKQVLGEYAFAQALTVWLHTMRCVTRPSQKYLGIKLWTQLSKSFRYVPFIMERGVVPSQLQRQYPTLVLDIRGYDLYPPEFRRDAVNDVRETDRSHSCS